MTVLDVVPRSQCDHFGVPLDWGRCRRCQGAGVLMESLTPGIDPRDPAHETREGDCPDCDGYGSLRALALATAKLRRIAGTDESPDPIRCESCGHPMSEGKWIWASLDAGLRFRGLVPDRARNWGVALEALRAGREPALPEVHCSPCDEGCTHGGPGRMNGPGGPDGTNVWMHFGADVDAPRWQQQASPTLRVGLAVEASWRHVDVRTINDWAHDLRPENLAIACTRCWAERA